MSSTLDWTIFIQMNWFIQKIASCSNSVIKMIQVFTAMIFLSISSCPSFMQFKTPMILKWKEKIQWVSSTSVYDSLLPNKRNFSSNVEMYIDAFYPQLINDNILYWEKWVCVRACVVGFMALFLWFDWYRRFAFILL